MKQKKRKQRGVVGGGMGEAGEGGLEEAEANKQTAKNFKTPARRRRGGARSKASKKKQSKKLAAHFCLI